MDANRRNPPPAKFVDPLTYVHATINEMTIDRDKYRGYFNWLLISNVIQGVVIIFLTTAIVMFRPATYFSTTPTGQITPIVPLEKPTVTSAAVQRFAVTTISEALSLNFRQWRTQLGHVETSFTTPGYKNFLEQLEKTNWIKTIEGGYFTATAIEISRPVLVSQGIGQNGVYGYVVEVPMTLILENQSERRKQEIKARIVVVRVPTSERTDGIAVDKVFVG